MIKSALWKLFVVLTTLILLVFSISKLYFDVRDAELIYLATRIEKGEMARNETPDVDEVLLTQTALATCRRSGLWPAVTLALEKIKRTNQSVDFDAWTANLGEGEQTVDAALACFPNDGGLWLLRASLTFAIGEEPERICEFLGNSIRYSAAEAEVLTGRLNLWLRVSALSRKTCGALFEKDAAVALRQLTKQQLAVALRGGRSSALTELNVIAAGVENAQTKIKWAVQANASNLF